MRQLQQSEKRPVQIENQPTLPLIKLPPSFQQNFVVSGVPVKRARRSPRTKKIRWLLSIGLILIVAIILFEQASGQGGAALADTLRATLGPTLTAQVESWYLGLDDNLHQLQYHLQGQQAAPPWATKGISSSTTPTTAMKTVPNNAASSAPVTLSAVPFTSLKPLVTPPIDGEGVWQPLVQSTPTATIPSLPIIARTFFRPDAVRPYAVVTMLQFDTRFMRLHMIAGTTEPGGPRGERGTGVIPTSDQQMLLAAFNGGFKYADGQYGLMTNGVTYVPPQPGAATIAVTKEGQILLGAWGSDPRLNTNNADLVAWRQNAALLINHDVINPLTHDGAAWGGTVLNSTYTWRSGLGITADGSLIYAAGDALSANTLGVALQAAGAVMAMQTDINPFWVRAFLYTANAGHLPVPSKLNTSMQGTGYEYLYGTARDFFYLTYATPTLPSYSSKREVTPQ